MSKKIIALIVAVAILLIGGFAVSVSLFRKNKTDTASSDNQTAVKTEVGTNAKGENIVVIGTDPQGTKIENGTYADGTKVEVATTKNGEIATESNGEYVIIYPTDSGISSSVPTSATNSSSSQQENTETSSVSSSKSDSSSKTNTDSSSQPSSSKVSSSKVSSSKVSSSQPSSSKVSSSKTGSSQTVSGEIIEQKTEKDTVSINGKNFKVGDTIRVSFYMQCNTKFTGVDLTINYDGKTLSAIDNVDVPNVVGPESNVELENRVRMIAVTAVAVNDFSTEKLLISCDFKVKKITDNPSDIALQIEEMLDNDLNNISSDNYTIRTELAKI